MIKLDNNRKLKKYLGFIILFACLSIPFNLVGQKIFHKFNYTTTQGLNLSNENLKGKTSIIVIGHLHCAALLFLLKDIQNVKIDTIQYLLFLENTPEQFEAFNSNDTSSVYGYLRYAFNLKPIIFPTVTVCCKDRNKIYPNGKVAVKTHCNKLKFKFRTLDSPTIFAIDRMGKIINKHIGWFYNLPDPKTTLVNFIKGKG